MFIVLGKCFQIHSVLKLSFNSLLNNFSGVSSGVRKAGNTCIVALTVMIRPKLLNNCKLCCSTSLLKTRRKQESACNKQFLHFSLRFLPIWRTFCYFYQVQNCCLQTLLVLRSLKFVIWEWVNIF